MHAILIHDTPTNTSSTTARLPTPEDVKLIKRLLKMTSMASKQLPQRDLRFVVWPLILDGGVLCFEVHVECTRQVCAPHMSHVLNNITQVEVGGVTKMTFPIYATTTYKAVEEMASEIVSQFKA